MNGPIIAYRANMGVQTSAPFANISSLSFDGTDDYVDCGVISTFQSTANFSISCWLKVPSLGALNLFVGTYTIGSNTIYAYITSSGEIAFVINNTYQRLSGTTFGTTLLANQWYNITVVFDGSLGHPNGMLIYIDGIVRSGGVSNPLPTITGTNTTQTYIGGLGGFSNRFNGTMDEVSFYDYSLSSAEALAIGGTIPTDLSLLATPPTQWYRNGDNGAWKSPQWLIPNNENFAANKVSNYSTQFDGIDDYLNIANNTTIGRTQNISYSIWVNLDVTSRQYIIGNTSSSNGGCGLQIESGDVLVFQMGDGGNDSFFNSRVANFSTYAPINTWNHILATWDGTDSKIYINGVLRNTWSPTLPYTIISYNAFTIGWRSAGFSFITNGKLDELALFDSGISIGDVWNGSGQPIDVSAVSGITNYWNMGDNSTFLTNWTVPDEVGSNPGTSANMTIEDRIGEAPNSTSNAVSFNMDEVDRVTDTP